MGLTLQSAARLFVDPVLALVFPTSCAACGDPMDHPRSGPLCDGCWGSLPRHGGGVCVVCEDEMDRKRLEAVPWAKRCISCQEKQEQGLL